jgi:archaeal type IV pilus assembly protein PilA
MTANIKPKSRLTKKRAVAPVIATLLMVAIAVVGGTIIFVFSQGFFNQSQISGTPSIESVKILGYDARDVTQLRAHDGTDMPANTGGVSNNLKNADERVAVYIKNDSVGQMLISQLSLGGQVYNYTTAALQDWNVGSPAQGSYFVMTNANSVLQQQAPAIQPGQTATLLVDLGSNFPIGRDTQFKLTTTNGAVFVGTVVMGQNSG